MAPASVRPGTIIRWLALLLGVLSVVAVLTQLLTREPDPAASEDVVADVGVPVRLVTLFDPYGSVGNADSDPAGAVDGDPNTAWSTPRYPVPLRSLGTPGVGLYLDLTTPVSVETLTLTLETTGVGFEVLARDDAPPTGATEADWEPLIQQRADGRDVTVVLDGHTARHWLVWFTDLQPVGETWHAALIDLRFEPVSAP